MTSMITALSPQHPFYTSVPQNICRPLLEIARLGYDAEDVKLWYLEITNFLLYGNSNSSGSSFIVDTPLDSHTGFSRPTLETAVSASQEATAVASATSPEHHSAQLEPSTTAWPDAFTSSNYSAASIPISAASEPLSIYPSIESNYISTPSASTPRPRTHENSDAEDFHTLAAPIPYNGPNVSTVTNWPSPHSVDNGELSRKRKFSDSPPYQMTMSSTAMPLFIPSNDTPFQPHPSSFTQLHTSPEFTYLTPISVIPSRKRRKAGAKGVKQILQPLHVSRLSV